MIACGYPIETTLRPQTPGNAEAERMSNPLSMVLTVSKDDLLKEEARQKRKREKNRGKKPT